MDEDWDDAMLAAGEFLYEELFNLGLITEELTAELLDTLCEMAANVMYAYDVAISLEQEN